MAKAAIPSILNRVCAACRFPSATCKLTYSENGKAKLWRCEACRKRQRERRFAKKAA